MSPILPCQMPLNDGSKACRVEYLLDVIAHTFVFVEREVDTGLLEKLPFHL